MIVNNVVLFEKMILNGLYLVFCLLFFYVKGEYLKLIKGLKEYIEYFISKKVLGKGFKFECVGLILMLDKECVVVFVNFKVGKVVK